MHLLGREEAGLRCLLQVALGGGAGAPVPIARIAAHEGLSEVYAAKLMRALRLAGLVESVRGAGGGYQLARPAGSITVWDAIQALDEAFLPTTPCDCEPADRIDCRRTTACAVASLWRRIGDEVRSALEAVSLAELCGGTLERPDRIELPILSASAPRTTPPPTTRGPTTPSRGVRPERSRIATRGETNR
ncbi:MAG: Rrf2 family transcriptional regulator [Spirochaetaceae bacterium]|nr:Rrf2 family transcriptional regulator [Myxococcales bacterium]MCB9723575.1 Rrf2 family transcriptional regulator [Spirochaetaceae bacterium]